MRCVTAPPESRLLYTGKTPVVGQLAIWRNISHAHVVQLPSGSSLAGNLDNTATVVLVAGTMTSSPPRRSIAHSKASLRGVPSPAILKDSRTRHRSRSQL